MLNLVVGDVHAVPEELDDCQALIGLICNVVETRRPDRVLFTGDQHNAHDSLSTRVLSFWRSAFKKIAATAASAGIFEFEIYTEVGNHDQANPIDRFPHAMLAYEGLVNVIDGPRVLFPGVAAMPYYYDPAEFLQVAEQLKAASPEVHTLFCHQTFVGADGSFYAKDQVRAASVPFRWVISGHIHTPQVVDKKVIYVGAPRWRTKDDAGKDRFIYLIEHSDRCRLIEKIPTDAACRRIYVFQDSPSSPAPLDTIPVEKRGLAQIRVEVSGPAHYVKERELELRAQGCRTRGIPDQNHRAAIRESEGIERAFGRFLDNFVPPNGSDKLVLGALLEQRLAK